MRQKPIILCILDGWGYNEKKEGNAIETGKTPHWHEYIQKYPTCMLATSGLCVGLPDGQMGNSEVGHTNLGAGRVVMQDLPRIDQAIDDGSLAENPVLTDMIAKLKQNGGTCHLMGLIGSGGVHASQKHIIALAKDVDAAGVPVDIHAFMDGRDTAPDSGLGFIKDLQDALKECKNTRVVTVSGRYYAMDRDNRWERVTLAYDAIVMGQGNRFDSATQALEASYQNKVTDEFVVPCVIGDYQGMKDGDAVMMANYRSDRAREITAMLAQPGFDKTPRAKVIHFSDVVAMTEYSSEHKKFMHILFPPEDLHHIFGEVVSQAGLTQLRIAETEKYAHVTFFFNGGREQMFKGEERILVPSPKVATYDLKPEMSAYEVTDKLVDAIKSDKFDVIIVNYANGDMVGHTGVMDAAIKAVEAVDTCLGRVVDATLEKGGAIFVTADHGNAEQMIDSKTGGPFTAHTNTPVKAVLIGAPKTVTGLENGRLADVAPTLLDLMNLPKPADMTGHSLLVKAK